MNNLNILKTLVDEGKELDENKASREIQEGAWSLSGNHGKKIILDVNKAKYKKWDRKVINFLESNHLSQFIEPKGLCNDFQEEHNGNCINFTPQYEKLQNLYNLCNLLNNKKMAIPINAVKIKKDFLVVASYKDTQLLDTYAEFIGRDNFREIYEELDSYKLFNFKIHFGSGISFSLHGDDFLTLKGNAELKKIQSWWRRVNWKKWIISIISLCIGGGIVINYVIKYQKQKATINVSGSNNTVILQQNQDNGK